MGGQERGGSATAATSILDQYAALRPGSRTARTRLRRQSLHGLLSLRSHIRGVGGPTAL